MKVAWFSAGITSAVATQIALMSYEDVEVFYIDIKSQHNDNYRFIKSCEQWFGKKINIVTNSKGFKDQFDVIEKTRFINGPSGARCTLELKKEVRFEVEKKYSPTHQIFGFDFSLKEINRAIRFQEQYDVRPVFPLIEKKLTKEECHGILQLAGIKQPTMYDLGYPNNNCIGCVKGKAGYWNKIRADFPDVFDKMAKLEREIGATCIKEDLKTGGSKRIYLDELRKSKGAKLKPVVPSCGIFCQIEMEEVIHKNASKVFTGELSIYDAA